MPERAATEADGIHRQLLTAVTAESAAASTAYLKLDHLEFTGASVPQARAAVIAWRSAMLALLVPLRRGEVANFERFGGYADQMLDEREFFIRKAIGWVLRETAKRQPQLVIDWLGPRAHRASGVTMREAVKYLPPGDRDELMAAYPDKRSLSPGP